MKLLIAFDVSGSVAATPINLLASHRTMFEARVKAFNATEICYVRFDDRISEAVDIEHKEVFGLIERVYDRIELSSQRPGGGGSLSREDLATFLEAVGHVADVVLFFTDGYIETMKSSVTQSFFVVEEPF